MSYYYLPNNQSSIIFIQAENSKMIHAQYWKASSLGIAISGTPLALYTQNTRVTLDAF